MNNHDDGDPLYQIARLALEAIQENRGKVPNPATFRDKIAKLGQGLSAEDEFIALCLWSGRCSLVHKLDESVRPKKGDYGVPDLLCVFEYQGRQLPVLVEVKSSRVKDGPPFGKKYSERLKKYADTLNLPLLVAFRWDRLSYPLWCLVEFQNMHTPRGSYKFKMPEMLKHDLTGLLLGNFHVRIREGSAISMTITKEEVETGGAFVGKLVDIHWETPEGDRVDPDGLLQWLFMLTEDEVEIQEFPDRVIQRFKKVGDEGAIATSGMQLALPVEQYRVGEHTDWGRLIDDHKFRFTLADLLKAANSGEGIVSHIFHQVPAITPKF